MTNPRVIPISQPRPLLVSVAETAHSLSTTTVLRLVNKGVLPSVRIGGSLRIPVDELLAFIKSNTEVAK